MDVLIIGLSNIVTRRVLPALRTLPSVGRIDVATRKAEDASLKAKWTHGEVYGDYSSALRQTRAALAYVSLVNSEHERWARWALDAGLHVVVDKPAFLGRERAEVMLDLAARHDVCLAEAVVFAHHPQIAAAKRVFTEAQSTPTRIAALFTFPPMDPANFRYRSSLGGGAVWDVGPYAAAAGRVFYGEEPESVHCQILAHAADVEIAFSTLQVFSEGRSLIGHFGFDAAYCNRLHLIGPTIAAELDRAFTTPPELANRLRVSGSSGDSTVEIPPTDSFACFMDHVLRCVAAREWGALAADLLADARTLDRMRTAATGG